MRATSAPARRPSRSASRAPAGWTLVLVLVLALALALALTSCTGSDPATTRAATTPADDGPADPSGPTGDPTAGPATEGTATPAAPTSRPIGPEDAVRTVVVGDALTVAAGEPIAWPDLLAAGLGDDGVPMLVTTTGAADAGFGSAPTFPELTIATAEGATQLVILFDADLGEGGTAGLPEAVERTMTEIERASPDARVVVVGPVTGADPATLARAAEQIRAAAEHDGATFVDPLAEGWAPLSQAEIAERMQDELRTLAAALAASGANR